MNEVREAMQISKEYEAPAPAAAAAPNKND